MQIILTESIFSSGLVSGMVAADDNCVKYNATLGVVV